MYDDYQYNIIGFSTTQFVWCILEWDTIAEKWDFAGCPLNSDIALRSTRDFL